MQPAVLPIRTDGDPLLRLKAKQIKPKMLKDAKMQQFIADMRLTLQHREGSGISAPQVGRSSTLYSPGEPCSPFPSNPS